MATRDTLLDLLAARDVETFCSRFFRAGGADPAPLPGLFREACRFAAVSLCPDEYPPPLYFVPHSYMGLIASWQIAGYLKPEERWRPVLQALWYLADDARKWGVRPEPAPQAMAVSPDRLETALTEAWQARDFTTFYSLFVAGYRQPELRALASRALLTIALKDHTNIGHKYIYAVRAYQLSRYPGCDDPALFCAPIHFLINAPRDPGLWATASARLESAAPAADSFAGNKKRLDYAGVMRLRDAILPGRDAVSGVVIDLLRRGYTAASIADGLLLVASHIIYYAPGDDLKSWWLYPIHAFNFTQSVDYALDLLAPHDRVVAVLVTGRYLEELAASIGPIAVDGSMESSGGGDHGSLPQLEAAIENTRLADALAQTRGLLASDIGFSRLAETLVGLCSRNERFLFTHAAKHLYYVLHTRKHSPAAWSNQHLLAYVKLLTLTPKAREVVTVADGTARTAG